MAIANWSIIREPDDRLVETRISVGATPKGEYTDERGRPQG